MAKDAVATMGTILEDGVGGRDAVHVAVVSAEAAGKLSPGQHVGRKPGSTNDSLIVGAADDAIGIVDPFLEVSVQKGQRFWLYLYPRTITSLRHNWTHPAFEDVPANETYSAPASKLASEQWLRAFCEHADCPPYETLIRLVDGESVPDGPDDDYPTSASNDGAYLTIVGRDAGGEIPPEFWDHVEVVTGRKFNRAQYFSCTC